MKKTREIVGLSLICIEEGAEYGTVKDLVIDPERGMVEYLVIDDGKWYLGAKVLPFGKVLGIGKDAITTELTEDIHPIGEIKGAIELAQKDVKLLCNKVYTKKGKYIGKVKEYYIDEEDGKIIGCQLEEENGRIIPSQSIITLGKNVLVVIEDVEATLVSEISTERSPEPKPAAAEIAPITFDEPEVEEGGPQVSPENPESISKEEDPAQESETARRFEQRQRQFLIGRKASKKITSEDGEILIEEGQVVSDSIIEKIKSRGKLVELTMNTRA